MSGLQEAPPTFGFYETQTYYRRSANLLPEVQDQASAGILQKNPERHEQRKRRQSDWQRNLSPEKKKAARLRALLGRHNITEDELAVLYEMCDRRCQVCKLDADENTWKGLQSQLCVDHIVVHGKRVVRGLLCNRCNTLLGLMGDNREGVMRYVSYLERYQTLKKEHRNGD